MPLSPGDKLGSYEILSKLGEGGMGEVYRARDTRLEREVAAKVLSLEHGNTARFEQEAKALAALNHPNILAIYDFGEQGGAPFLISELVQGETLRGKIGKLSQKQTLDIAAQICDGLGAAHAIGIAHRDLKPENVMITREGVVKILDFGLARRKRAPRHDEATLTAGGMVMGTPGYMSPEQAAGEESGPLADIFSMGVVLYEMLAGKQPFQRASTVESMAATLREDVEPLPESISPGVRQIVMRCLEKLPGKRFQSPVDLAFALRSLTATTIATTGGIAPVARPGSHWKGAAAMAVAALLVGFAIRHALIDDRSLPHAAMHLTPFAFERDAEVNPEFSPDGKFVAYVRQRQAYTGWGDLIVRPLTGAPTEPLAKAIDNLRWSPDGSKIFYRYRERGGAGVWSVLTAGGEPKLVLKDDSFGFALSPDGMHLVFARQHEAKKWKLFDSSPPGAEPKTLVEMPGEMRAVMPKRFSPDGRQLIVLANPGGSGRSDLWLVPFAGGAPRPLKIFAGNLSWFPDSRHILFTAGTVQTKQELRAAAVDNMESSYLLLRPQDTLQNLSLSNDGSKLVYSTGTSSKGLIEYDLDSKESNRIEEGRTDMRPGNYFADGVKFLYQARSAFRGVTLRVRAAGEDRTFLDLPGITSASISPDGKRVAYSVKGQLWVFAPGGKPVTLTAGNDDISNLCWSGDGKDIAYSRGDVKKRDLYRIHSGGGESKRILENVPGSCAWSNDKAWIATGLDGDLQLVHAATGERSTIAKSGIAMAKVFNSRGQLVVLRTLPKRKQELVELEIPSGRVVRSETLPIDITDGGSFSPDDFAIHPSGRRVIYPAINSPADLWMMDMPRPATGLARLWRKWTLPPE